MALTIHEIQILSAFCFGWGLSAIGIIIDAVLTIKGVAWTDKSSDKFLKNRYVRFIPHVFNLGNHILLLLYSTQLLFIRHYWFIALSALGIVAECAMIGVIVYYIRVRPRRIERCVLLSFIAIMITIIVIVVVIAMLHYPETHHRRRRGRFVGVVLTVAAFITVVPISLDIWAVWKTRTISEVSGLSTLCGLLGSAGLLAYCILTHRVYLAARHGIALAMYGFILVALCAHTIISRWRPPSTDGIAMTGRIRLPADVEDLLRFIEQQTTRQLPPYYEDLFRFMEEQISSLGMTIARTTGSLPPPSTPTLETVVEQAEGSDVASSSTVEPTPTQDEATRRPVVRTPRRITSVPEILEEGEEEDEDV